MPEGHTLHRLAEQINRLFTGRQWRVSSPQGRFSAGAARLTDRVPERAEAWGKQLFVHLGADIWQVHLGLYGAFSFRGDETFAGAASLGAPRTSGERFTPQYDDAGWIIPAPPTGSVRARIHVPHGWADLRGPARCQVLNPMQYQAVIARLGPDPLHQPAGLINEQLLAQFRQHLARRRDSIAAALMDQAVIAGVGNIYRAESLFLEQLDPDAPAQELEPAQTASLWQTLTEQLRTGVAEGIIRTLRPEDPHLGARGADRKLRRHWVYQHQGTPCLRCGETIRMRELKGRRLYWCPGCQGR
ncbi:Fpg/Nei family DNA glycosylase [Nesterenkonia alkaliphila]|uniref:DNA-(apurinic or apyrimidinic site) lyase n=1 Tax=Nesterenkonia alkaliphila TaxID=1463631 RepID=A0A7K1UM28_9MICC|nr:DNA-formamidopyrimidine glycosylase family protein [Nesterenkonia alkaliphila]MVT27538.1 Fpg/Nei family DNA glycosylase [Nesterenkonia alkaliphila]GFZ80236.1 endonuclease VIII [Nesterenkonia alkaliphila]